jgi:hypothetical protein
MKINPALPTSYEYVHYTSGNIEIIDLNRAYAQYTGKLAFHTPNGLWLSVAGIHDWEQYCIKNNCRLDALKTEFQILLKKTAKIIILHNKAAFEKFIQKYGYYSGHNKLELSIRWEEIISTYQGIAVTRIFPKLNNMVIWNKIWRYTAACIWDLQAVAKMEKL